MNIFATGLLCACSAALIAGCGSAPYRSGKGDDHQVTYRPANVDDQRVAPAREVVYVDRPVYYETVPAYRVVPVQPTYRVVTSDPAYTTVTTRPAYQSTTTVVPVTRYYYYYYAP
jgi:hypothetical protein